MAVRWPLTGRTNELRHVEAAVHASACSGIVVSGQAGVGKSRLAREALLRATARGCGVRWAVGTSSGRSVPLGAFAEWAQPDGADTLTLVRGMVEALTAVPGGRAGVVIGVDDGHLLDDLSAFVLHLVVRRGGAKVVMTVRDGEPISDGLAEVWQAGEFEQLALAPLCRADTLALLSSTLGGPMEPDGAARLWDLTRGNALYLHNIVERELADGRLKREGRYWRWTGDPVVPADLVDMIEARFGALPAAVNDVIDALAIAEPITLDALQRITDPDAVETADSAGLITVCPASAGGDVEVRLAHPLYAEVRRRHAPPTRLRRCRALVAAELAVGPHRDDIRVVVRRAELSLDSDLDLDPDLLLRAAQGAVWLADLPLAERLATASIEAGDQLEAFLVSAHVLSWMGRGAEADAVLCAIPAAGVDDWQRGRVAFLRAANTLCAEGDPDRAIAVIDAVGCDASPAVRACADAFRPVYWAAMGRPARVSDSARGLALDELPAIVGAVTAWAITLGAGDAGRTSAALVAAVDGYEIASSSYDAAQMKFVIADAEIGALLMAGRIREAVDAADRIHQQAADLPGAAQLLSAALMGRAAFGAGRLDRACALLGPAVELLYAAGDSNGFGYQYQLPLTIGLAMLGRADEASVAVAELESHRYASWRYLDYSFAIAKAWATACQGGVSEAISVLSAASGVARAAGQFGAELLCLQTATQFGDASTGPRLAELVGAVEGPRVSTTASFARALRDGDGAGLVAVSEEYERMGDVVAAVDASAHAAVVHDAEGHRGAALTHGLHAERLAARCGARTPALLRAVQPLPLTGREREIATLLGQGLSSRAVSERLVLSVRTVENHIYKAMGKTGAGSREELAALVCSYRTATQ